ELLDSRVDLCGAVLRSERSHELHAVEGVEVHVPAGRAETSTGGLHAEDAIDHTLRLGKLAAKVFVDRPDVSPTPQALHVGTGLLAGSRPPRRRVDVIVEPVKVRLAPLGGRAAAETVHVQASPELMRLAPLAGPIDVVLQVSDRLGGSVERGVDRI